MQLNPTVSVVIPSFNHKKYIGKAIESILSQSYSNWECIIIDDGSSDGSFEYIRNKVSNDFRFNLIARENRGAHQTINECIALASGEYIAILNSDDFYEPDRLLSFVNEATIRKGLFFGISSINIVDCDGKKIDKDSPYNYYYNMFCKIAENKPDIVGFWGGNIAMTSSNLFFSKSIFDKVGPFRALRYAHDWDWALRASSKFDVQRLKTQSLNYRIHGANTIFEGDRWAHIIEDAFVWASMLRRESVELGNNAPRSVLFEALTKNCAFHLLPTIYLMSDQRSESAQLELIESGLLKKELRPLFDGSLFDPLLAEPMPTIACEIAEIRKQIKLQAALIHEQHKTVVDDSINCSMQDEFSQIKQSIFWKSLGWLWRLETRKARKLRRSSRNCA